MLHRILTTPNAGTLYNIGSGVGTSLNKMVSIIENATGKKAQIVYEAATLIKSDAFAEQIYQMTPIRHGIQQVPGRILLKQIFFKIKRRVKLLLGVTESMSVSAVHFV